MRDALARHDFGQVFAISRKWAGISYSKTGAACGIKPERVGTLARGLGAITSFEKIVQIADALLIPGHMVGLAPRAWENVLQSTANGEAPAIPMLDGDECVFRRDFIKSGAVLGASVVVGGPAGSGIRRIGSDVPARLRQRTARLRRLDNVLGGGDTFRIYLAEYRATKKKINEGTYSEATGRSLISVLAEQAQQAGWAAFDAGEQDKAVRLYQASQVAAEAAGESLLVGNALAFLAYEQIQSDPREAVRLATASCEAAGAAAVGSAGALLHERRAWTHAVAGNACEAERALDTARSVHASESGEPDPDWSTWVDETELQIMAGRCWTELRRPLRAVPILESVLETFDDAYARDKALYTSWLADSYLSAGEVEESAAAANRVLDLSAGVASVRPRRQLARVIQNLAEHSEIGAVSQVLDKARAS
ncbi:twin-arginine translocation signal domain-containing protein [Luteipulveratus mongoliensis]|nr:twin-arginine translocation signal domain-containing protein [Luteipulveratus mongoliensis]